MILTLDIETVPAQRPDVRDEIAAGIKPPPTYKKPESIAEWMRDEAPRAIDEAYRKTGLDGAFGQICVIGAAFDDEPPLAVWRPNWQDEAGILQAFGALLLDTVSHKDFVTVVGHNVASFDLRFLAQRSIVNGIRPHSVILKAAQAKPWETEKVFDTMVQWAGFGKTISLDKLCNALGINTPKGAITGATVWDHVRAGHIDAVADYCRRDIEATRQVYKRMTYQDTCQDPYQDAYQDDMAA